MGSYEATGDFFAADLADLTAGLYRFILAAEPMVQSRRPRREESLDRLRDQARTITERFNNACQRAGAQWDEARQRAGVQWDEARQRAGEQWDEVRQQAEFQWEVARQRAGEQWDETRAKALLALEALVAETSANLQTLSDELDKLRPGDARLVELWKGLGRNYEALRVHARRVRNTSTPVTALGSIKPRNYTRNLFHVSMGLSGVLVYQFLLTRTQAVLVCGSLLGLFLLTDLVRRLFHRFNDRLIDTVFAPFVRPEEAHQVPAATWYMAGLFLACLAFPLRAVQLGVMVLALADPLASLVGKRWGQRKLRLQKSWAGSLTFFVVALAVSAFFLTLPGWALGMPLGVRLLAAPAIALAGTLAELFSGRIDDNFTIPLIAGGVAALLVG